MSKKKRRGFLQEADRVAQKLLRQVSDVVSAPQLEPLESRTSPTALQGKFLECFLCGGRVEIKLSKKDRPYFHCLNCYLQCFVRGDVGIKRLARLMQGDHG
jgi:hypothetical protein